MKYISIFFKPIYAIHNNLKIDSIDIKLFFRPFIRNLYKIENYEKACNSLATRL